MSIDPQKITILLVEDAAVMRNIEKRTLNSLGFKTIIEAEDGAIAIKILQETEGIDIVISDWNMPNTDGFQLLEWIRTSNKYSDLPFIMATGHGDKKQQQKAVEAGTNSFIIKPFDNKDLQNKIDEAFGIKKKEKTIQADQSLSQESDSGKVKLRIAHIQITDHLVLGVLKHMIEKGDVVPRHFELETKCLPGWNSVADALEKGRVDAACVLAPIAMDIYSFGIPIKMILLAHKNGSIFVRNRSGDYQEPFQDYFRNKSFLIPHKLSIHHMLAHMFFEKIGLKSGMNRDSNADINFEVVTPVKMPEFLTENVDACGFMVAEPFGTKVIDSSLADLQFLSGEIWPQHPCCVVAMRDEFIDPHTDAVYELTEMLVKAGKFIEEKPDLAAEIAVNFLDPDKNLGLKVPMLKNVLTEEQGIKAGDLYPLIEDFEIMQDYMVNKMGISSTINLEKFIDTRFARAAYKDRVIKHQPSSLYSADDLITNILQRGVSKKPGNPKTMLDNNKAGRTSIDPQNITILLVEDAAVMRNIEKKTLNSLGFKTIIEAEDGTIAIKTLQETEGIDIVISDWNMPNTDGFKLLKWIRSSDNYSELPFIMATGQGDKKQQQKAVEAGVNSFIAKPFDSIELKNKIDEAFGIKKIEKKIFEEQKGPKLSASGKVKLRIAHIQITDHLVLGVLKHLIAKGDMAPQHFVLETKCLPGWNPVADALEKGRVDAACVLAPIAMDLYSFDVPIKMILLAHKNGSIFVRNRRGDYREPFQDYFRNKSFLIPHKLSIHHMLAHMFFDRIGLRAGMDGDFHADINFEVVTPVKMPQFLKENVEACGFMVAEPIGTKAIASNLADLQFLSGELWAEHPCCVVAMRDDFIGPHMDAVYELTEMLVKSGKFIEEKPELAAEIAVDFLDPDKRLGLKVPLLKNVLKEKQGIKAGDLYPLIEDFEIMQDYMVNKMGVSSMINLEKFIDTRFAKAAYKDRIMSHKPSNLHVTTDVITNILHRGFNEDTVSSKAMLNKEGKYLTFKLGDQEYGIDILKIKEIIGMMPIRSIPCSANFIKGVINLRDNVIPVIDLRLKFGMEEIAYTDRTCIIVLELDNNGNSVHLGIAVDTVLEVLSIKASEIENTPYFGSNIDTRLILAIAKMDKGIKILLDIDEVFEWDTREETEIDQLLL